MTDVFVQDWTRVHLVTLMGFKPIGGYVSEGEDGGAEGKFLEF